MGTENGLFACREVDSARAILSEPAPRFTPLLRSLPPHVPIQAYTECLGVILAETDIKDWRAVLK